MQDRIAASDVEIGQTVVHLTHIAAVVHNILEHYDLAGKRIVPFCTNEGSGMGSSERDLKKTCAGATVERGLSIRGCEAAKSKKKVSDWAKGLV